MREPTKCEEIKKNVILKQCFECIVEYGIEKVSIKAFSKATGMTASSLYYWFKDKNEIVLDSTEYGIKVITDVFFEHAMEHILRIDEISQEFQELAKHYQSYLKTIFQIVASPQYGDEVTQLSKHITVLYDTYAKKMVGKLGLSYSNARTIVDLFISSIMDCTLWNEWEKLSRELELLLSLVVNKTK